MTSRTLLTNSNVQIDSPQNFILSKIKTQVSTSYSYLLRSRWCYARTVVLSATEHRIALPHSCLFTRTLFAQCNAVAYVAKMQRTKQILSVLIYLNLLYLYTHFIIGYLRRSPTANFFIYLSLVSKI